MITNRSFSVFDFHRKNTTAVQYRGLHCGLVGFQGIPALKICWTWITRQESLPTLLMSHSLSICWKLQIKIHNLSKCVEQLWAMSWANGWKSISQNCDLSSILLLWGFKARCNFNQVQASKISTQIERNSRGFCGQRIFQKKFDSVL